MWATRRSLEQELAGHDHCRRQNCQDVKEIKGITPSCFRKHSYSAIIHRSLILELKLIADVGLVGFPNVILTPTLLNIAVFF